MAFSVVIGITYLLVLLFASATFPINNDEGWMFVESYYFMQYTPYSDYFSHRLPLFQMIYGAIMEVFGSSLYVMRVASSAFSASAIAITIYVCFKLTRNYSILVVVSLLAWNVLIIGSLSQALIYSLVGFIFSVSVLLLYKFRNNYKLSMHLFLWLQVLIWSAQYPVSAQFILVILFSLLILYHSIGRHEYNFNALISLPLVLPILLTVLYMFFKSDYRIIYDTVTFNFDQVSQMIEKGIVPDHQLNLVDRILDKRKREVVEFYPIIPLLLVSVLYLSTQIIKYIKSWNCSWEYQIVLYSLILFLGYYGAFLLIGYDFPVSKTYLVFPGMILLAVSMKTFFDSIDRKRQVAISFVLLLSMLMWPYVQGVSSFKSYDPHADINSLISTVKSHYTGGEIFSLFPVINQGGIIVDHRLSMELFSFLHDLNEQESEYHHLSTIETVLSKFSSKSYSLVMVSNRFRNTKKHMSRMLDNKIESLRHELNRNYYLVDTYESKNSFLGHVEIYKPIQ